MKKEILDTDWIKYYLYLCKYNNAFLNIIDFKKDILRISLIFYRVVFWLSFIVGTLSNMTPETAIGDVFYLFKALLFLTMLEVTLNIVIYFNIKKFRISLYDYNDAYEEDRKLIFNADGVQYHSLEASFNANSV